MNRCVLTIWLLSVAAGLMYCHPVSVADVPIIEHYRHMGVDVRAQKGSSGFDLKVISTNRAPSGTEFWSDILEETASWSGFTATGAAVQTSLMTNGVFAAYCGVGGESSEDPTVPYAHASTRSSSMYKTRFNILDRPVGYRLVGHLKIRGMDMEDIHNEASADVWLSSYALRSYPAVHATNLTWVNGTSGYVPEAHAVVMQSGTLDVNAYHLECQVSCLVHSHPLNSMTLSAEAELQIELEIIPSNVVHLVGMEVTQSVQDLRNSVSLIGDKLTFVRTYFQSDPDSDEPVLRPRLRGYRNGEELDKSPLDAEKPLSAYGEYGFRPYIFYPPYEDGTVTHYERAVWGNSANFALPPEWCKEGTTTLVLDLTDAVVLCHEPAEPGGKAEDGIIKAQFKPSPEMKVRYVRVAWRDAAGKLQPAPFLFDVDNHKERLTAMYPVSYVETSPGYTECGPLHAWTTNLNKARNFARINRALILKKHIESNFDWLYYGILEAPPDGGGLSADARHGVACGITPSGRYPFRDGAFWSTTHPHEVGHVLGLEHAVASTNILRATATDGSFIEYREDPCGTIAPASAPLFPYINLVDGNERPTLGPMNEGFRDIVFGLNTAGALGYDPLCPDHHFELMSYCRDSKSPRENWPSKHTYETLYNALITEKADAMSADSLNGSYLLVGGEIDLLGGTATLDPCIVLSPATAPPAWPPGDYSLVTADELGVTLSTFPFEPTPCWSGGGTSEIGVATFSLLIPSNEAIAKLSIEHGGTTFASHTVSDHRPQITGLLPSGGGVTGTLVNVSWQSSDADADTLSHYLSYSEDGGNNWILLVTDFPGTNTTVNTDLLAGTTNGRLRVQASDGFHTASVSSGALTVPEHVPGITISAPLDGSAYYGDVLIPLRCSVMDMEDGLGLGTGVLWTATSVGVVATGAVTSVGTWDLEEGNQELTALLTDAAGNTATDTVRIAVLSGGLNIDMSAGLSGPAAQFAGSNMVLTVQVTNEGSDTAGGAGFELLLPNWADVVSIFPVPASHALTGNRLGVSLSPIPAGQTDTLDVTIFPTAAGTFTSSVEIVYARDNNTLNDAAAITTIFAPAADADSDGIPDWWEERHYGGRTNAVAGVDSDGDTATAIDEYRADTCPTCPKSYLGIDGITVGDEVTIGFNSSSRREYDLQWSSNLFDSVWHTLRENIAGHGLMMHLSDTNNLSGGWYRVLTEP